MSVPAETHERHGCTPSYWFEGESAEIEVERTDDDEIRVGTHVHGEKHESASFYLGRSEAIRLMLALAQAVGDR